MASSDQYYSDVTPGVTSGTEGFSGGGWESSRQTSILLNPTVSDSSYGVLAPRTDGAGVKSSYGILSPRTYGAGVQTSYGILSPRIYGAGVQTSYEAGAKKVTRWNDGHGRIITKHH
jgi:hypothetical protein